jgi:hypothetical protein
VIGQPSLNDNSSNLHLILTIIWSSVLVESGTTIPPSTYSFCDDPYITNNIILSLISRTTSDYLCGSVTWSISEDGQLCINCLSSCDLPSSDNFVIVPSVDLNCGTSRSQELSQIKAASSFNVLSQLIIAESVPTFNISLIDTTATSVSVEVNLTHFGYGSITYCAAFLSPDIKLTSQIKRSGVFVTLPRQIRFKKTFTYQSLVIENLIPSTTYSVFCFAEDSYLHSTSITTVISLGINATTQCCRRMSYQNTPNPVSGVLAFYTVSIRLTSLPKPL